MIDRSLNYGRHLIEDFLSSAAPYEAVLDVGAGPGLDLLAARAISPGASLYAIECSAEYRALLFPRSRRLETNFHLGGR